MLHQLWQSYMNFAWVLVLIFSLIIVVLTAIRGGPEGLDSQTRFISGRLPVVHAAAGSACSLK